VKAAIGLAPVSDLVAAHDAGLGDNAVDNFIRRHPDDGPDRYRTASPAQMLPLGVIQVIIHGTVDEAVPVSMSRSYVATAENAGDEVRYHELAGADHMNVIDSGHEAWSVAVAEFESLR
jgi:dipeptidyl aminopeptidase/acylaminoacyl peptidase